jgi:hypothetical protein
MSLTMNRPGPRHTDEPGRSRMLRGGNLGGSSKQPFGVNGSSPDSLKNPESVSFVGRPFPLEEAEEHFGRLKSWGFTFVRFIITWEALEHSGPGIYDEAYLAYLRKILLIAEKFGISVLMDPHQDVWSRWTGGDGAPAWTLEKLGMDISKLETVGAAVTRQGNAGNHDGRMYPPEHGKFRMIWPVNYSLYAAATMFTLFFGGNVFAPDVTIEGESAQDWLREKYLAAFRHCFRRLKNCKAIVGWGTMNEPHPGFIGCRDLLKQENFTILKGRVPNPFQAMAAASGSSVEVPVYKLGLKGWKTTGKETINPRGISLFKEGYTCPWKQAGVWTDEGGVKLLKSDHFSTYNGRPVRFTEDFLKPFMFQFIERMKGAERPVLFFIEGVPHGENPSWKNDDPAETVNAFHHYDGFTLFTKTFRPWLTADKNTRRIIIGRKKAAAHYSAKLAEAKTWTREHMGGMPCLLGEFGLPFDLNKRKAFKTGDYRPHEEALSLYYDGIDENLLSSTIWNYSADNTNEEGDHWNGEDLSIVSGGKERAAAGWLRPYPAASAGTPLKFYWDRKKAALYFRFRADAKIEAPTEIFLPSRWFGEHPLISAAAADGGRNLRTEHIKEEQRLLIYNDGYTGEAEIRVGHK